MPILRVLSTTRTARRAQPIDRALRFSLSQFPYSGVRLPASFSRWSTLEVLSLALRNPSSSWRFSPSRFAFNVVRLSFAACSSWRSWLFVLSRAAIVWSSFSERSSNVWFSARKASNSFRFSVIRSDNQSHPTCSLARASTTVPSGVPCVSLSTPSRCPEESALFGRPEDSLRSVVRLTSSGLRQVGAPFLSRQVRRSSNYPQSH